MTTTNNTATVTGEQIWAEVLKDAEFTNQPDATLQVMRPFVEALPEILADMLAENVSLGLLMKAKIAFLRYCLDNDFIKKVVAATPDEMLGFFDRDELPGMLEETLSNALNMAESLTGDALAQILEENGLTEEQVMLSPQTGLNDQARKAYEGLELTIGELLLIQPMLIVKTS